MSSNPTQTDVLVKTNGLEVRYGRLLAVDHITLELNRGSVTGLLGPNGAGKTTLLKTLLGFLRPTAGTVEVLGANPVAAPLVARQRVGFMPESEAWFPGLSGLEAVVLAGRVSGMPKEAAFSRAYEVLDFLGMDEVRHRPVEGYSVGLKQKVKLAQALVHGPEVLFLDEPMGGLDPNSRDEMMNLVAGIARSGVTLVFSSHVLHDVERLCDRVLAMAAGRILFHGRIDDLRDVAPGHCFVRVRNGQQAFTSWLQERNVTVEPDAGRLRVVLPSSNTNILFEAAMATGAELREVVEARDSLEEAFIKLVTRA